MKMRIIQSLSTSYKFGLFLCCFFLSTTVTTAQTDIDLSSPSFKPSILTELNEEGYLEFRLNKPTNTDIPVHGFKMEIELANIKPLNGALSLSGSGAELFTWEYDETSNILIGTQKKQITGFLYSGTIGLDFIVTELSSKKEPKNGFSVTIYDLLDKYDIVKKNNKLSNYTWTRGSIDQ